ncbi:PAS domain S-box protein [Novosphingobium terrae]|uniref:PAS domain S-box protein n=1 Tax=Novosphingobium terrae TaxID=2726189 RepID=UPI001F12C2A2|nr:PAS domain S-box protein [Novosphingobium terrae]
MSHAQLQDHRLAPPEPIATEPFLAGGGLCARIIATKDWAATPLGPMADWPPCLKGALSILLRARVPIVMLWGEHGVMLYNDAYSGFAGGRHPALFGSNVREGWQEVADFNDHVMKVVLSGGGTLHYRDQELTLHRHGQPEQVWMDLDYSPVPDESGQPAGVICFLAETTERVAAERKTAFMLALSDDLRGLTTPSDIMNLTASRLGEHLGASRVFYAEIAGGIMTVERDHHHGVDSIVGVHSLEAFGPDLLAAYKVGTPVVVRDIPADPRLSRPAREGLGSRQVGAFIDVVLFEETQWVGLLAVQSATPRIWTPAEETLVQEAGERVKIAIERARAERDRLWDLSQDMLARAGYDGMMSAVSPAWTKVLGWSEHELLTRGYASFMHPEDRQPTLDAVAGMALTRQPIRFENRIATSDGAWKPIEWTVAPEPDGINFVAVGRDLSDAKAREAELDNAREALRQSQKMEAMGSLTGGVAHDFNNLLTPILGSLDLLVRKGTGGEREQRLIGAALQSAERAKTLVQRLLAFARRQPLQPTAVDIPRLVEGMVDLLRSTLGPTITVQVDLDKSMPPAKADPNQMEMALLNLAVNARDAMPEGGTLILSARRGTLSQPEAGLLLPGSYIRLGVSDTGTGMDAETARRAAEPFFSTKGVGKGTGLGLSMAHGLAAQLGGRLTIESEPGHGTTIELWLPVSESAPDSERGAIEAARAACGSQGLGIALLVDDDPFVRMSTADMLDDLGYEVMEADTAEEALRLVKGGVSPVVLLTDHLMPGMSGTELAREIRVLRPSLPVLIVSGFAEEEGIDSDIPRLTKPFRNAELEASLAALRLGAAAF